MRLDFTSRVPQLQAGVEDSNPHNNRRWCILGHAAGQVSHSVRVQLYAEEYSTVPGKPLQMERQPANVHVFNPHRGEVPIVVQAQRAELARCDRSAIELHHVASSPCSTRRRAARWMCSSVNNRALRKPQPATLSESTSGSAVAGSWLAAKCTVASSSRLYGVSKPSAIAHSADTRSLSCGYRSSSACVSSNAPSVGLIGTSSVTGADRSP